MRWSEIFGKKVETAIAALPVLAKIKDQFDWEAVPVLIMGEAGPDLRYILAMSLPVIEGGPDYVQVVNKAPADPTDGQEVVSRVVRALADAVLTQQEKAQAQLLPALNGKGEITSPGGLIIPPPPL